MKFSIREMQEKDIPFIVDYFVNADASYLKGMGAEKSKLPKRDEWIEMLQHECAKPYNHKKFYYLIWLIDGKAVGHSNINNIQYGKVATMHLHLWKKDTRKKGIGSDFVKKSIPYYFKNFQIKMLICEPYSGNPAPNKVLKKVGFEFIRAYETIPGWINYQQVVHRYEMSRELFEDLMIKKLLKI